MIRNQVLTAILAAALAATASFCVNYVTRERERVDDANIVTAETRVAIANADRSIARLERSVEKLDAALRASGIERLATIIETLQRDQLRVTERLSLLARETATLHAKLEKLTFKTGRIWGP